MARLLPGIGLLCAGALSESNSLHAAGCVILDSLVAEEIDHNASSRSDCSFCRAWHRHGVTHDLVGTLPSGYEPRSVYLSRSDRANTRGEPRCLVLPEQNLLAVQSHFYLSKMEHLTDKFHRLYLVTRGPCGGGGHFLWRGVFRR